jgi:thioredoxin 1
MKLFKFSATWCQPCQTLSKVINETDLPVDLVEFDVDYEADKAQSFNVRGVPTLILIDDTGEEISRKVGSMSSTVLTEWVNSYVSNK